MKRPKAKFETVCLHLPAQECSSVGDSVEMAFEPIPAGECMMGERDGGPLHNHGEIDPPVKVIFSGQQWDVARGKSLAYYMARYPVTQTQFDCWRETDAYATWLLSLEVEESRGIAPEYNEENIQSPDPYAYSVAWSEAIAFCAWLNSNGNRYRIPSGFVARLPFEAEWEYACRAGSDTEYYSGDGESAVVPARSYLSNPGSKFRSAEFRKSNEWGLFDLHGEVWEWCLDEWKDESYRQLFTVYASKRLNLPVNSGAGYRVVRGGSWEFRATECRSAIRTGLPSFNSGWFAGFRVGLFPVSGASPSGSGAGVGAFPDEAAERAEAGQDTAPAEPPLDLSKVNFKTENTNDNLS